MYRLLSKVLPEPLANALTGLWFALVLAIVLLFASVPQGEFRYLNL